MFGFGKKTPESTVACDHQVCSKCKHLFANGTGKTIRNENTPFRYDLSAIYCKSCAPEYDVVRYRRATPVDPFEKHYFKRVPEHYREVGENGESLPADS